MQNNCYVKKCYKLKSLKIVFLFMFKYNYFNNLLFTEIPEPGSYLRHGCNAMWCLKLMKVYSNKKKLTIFQQHKYYCKINAEQFLIFISLKYF